MGGFLEHHAEPADPTPESLIIARPGKALATVKAPDLMLIDGFSFGHDEQEDEELVLMALSHFGWL
jgi:hypothetical protein